MSVRLLFHRISKMGPELLKKVREGIEKELFCNRSDNGFFLESANKLEISGRYVQRFASHESTLDPFGNSIGYERTIYRHQKFTIRAMPGRLILYDCGTLARRLLGRFADFTEFEFFLSPVILNPLHAFECLKGKLERATVTMALVQSSIVGPDISVSARFEGTGDVFRAVSRLFPKRKDTFSRIKVRVCKSGIEIICEFREDGRITIFGNEWELLMPDIESLILEAIRGSS